MTVAAYRELEFDLAGALRDRLQTMFGEMSTAPLERSSIEAEIPNAQGVYQLFYRDELVYVGKTDAEAGLKARLRRHAEKIRHRVGLNPDDVRFKAIRIFVFTVMDLESSLLKSGRPSWNGGGFGSNDPGRERDTTKIKNTNFDAVFPLDISRTLPPSPPHAAISAEMAIKHVQDSVPWKIRRQNLGGRSRKPHSDLDQALVALSGQSSSAWDTLAEIVSQLPAGWQATALKSHVILYKERRAYPEPLALVLSPGSRAEPPKDE